MLWFATGKIQLTDLSCNQFMFICRTVHIVALATFVYSVTACNPQKQDTLLSLNRTEPEPVLSVTTLMQPGIATRYADPDMSLTLHTPILANDNSVVLLTGEEELTEDFEAPAGQCFPPDDLWLHLSRTIQFTGYNQRSVSQQIEWYLDHPDYLQKVTERARPYLHYLVTEAEKRNIPVDLALVPIVESAFQPFAYSPGQAAGLWQFIPSTGKHFGLEQNWWYDGRRDIYAATNAAYDYLQRLANRFDNDWLLALAAYNAGEGNVSKAITQNRKRGRKTDYWSLNLPSETRNYVPKLLGLSEIIANPVANGILLDSISNEPFLQKVDIESQIDLDVVAELADMTLEEIYRYNPGFNRWSTAPDGPHYLLLPISRIESFQQRLADYPPEERIRWVRYNVASGDVLGMIAKKFNTSTEVLRDVNKLSSNTIKVGQVLTIPAPRSSKSTSSLPVMQQQNARLYATPQKSKIHYTVQNGDSFWKIARTFNTTTNKVIQWNGMSGKDTLRPGQKLVIWQEGGEKSNHPLANTTQKIGYTVRSGDSLDKIARKFGVTSAKIRQWNSLHRKKYIYPGEKLTIHVDVRNQGGAG